MTESLLLVAKAEGKELGGGKAQLHAWGLASWLPPSQVTLAADEMTHLECSRLSVWHMLHAQPTADNILLSLDLSQCP